MTKIRTSKTVYDNKVIDIISLQVPVGEDSDLEQDLADALEVVHERIFASVAEGTGRLHIKVIRPLSDTDKAHRLGVVEKKMEKAKGYSNRWAYDREYREYLRLKARFENG